MCSQRLESASGEIRDVVLTGRYVDVHECRDDEWKLKQRKFLPDWERQEPVDPSTGGPAGLLDECKMAFADFPGRAAGNYGKRDESDPSYRLLGSPPPTGATSPTGP